MLEGEGAGESLAGDTERGKTWQGCCKAMQCIGLLCLVVTAATEFAIRGAAGNNTGLLLDVERDGSASLATLV
jgi:hypothetical protein